VTTAEQAWDALDAPWRAAFDEAWASFRAGCFGIGAVLANADGDIVARGRNRVLERRGEGPALSETLLAHAEMNALLDHPIERGTAEGLTLSTTVQPCLMCMSTIVTLRVAEVRYATADNMFEGVNEALAAAPYCTERMPATAGPLAGKLGSFALLLPMMFTRIWTPQGRWSRRYAEREPQLTDLADELAQSGRLREFDRPLPALDDLWDALP
jgi:tRNA(Arg) A34 adenosine deaminase TadA